MGGNSSSLVASTLFYGVATIPPLVVGITYMFPGDLLASHREFFDDTSAVKISFFFYFHFHFHFINIFFQKKKKIVLQDIMKLLKL